MSAQKIKFLKSPIHLTAFRSRNYRLFFISQELSMIGTFMTQMAIAWLIYSFTHSAYLCIAVSTWLVYPTIVMELRLPLLSAIAVQATLFILSLLKFSKFPSFHTYTAKAWGIALFIAVLGLFGFGKPAFPWGAVAFGAAAKRVVLCWVNSLEEILMTLVLPQWQHGVLSLVHALKRMD